METECQEKIHHPYRAILRAMSRRYTVRSVSVRFERRRRAPASPSRLRLPSRTGRTDDGRHPFVQIIPLRSRAAIRRRFQRNLRQLLLDASRAARQRTLLLAHPPEPLLFSFLRSFVRWRPSRSPRVARLVSSRLGRRLDSVVVSARRTLTSRRRRRDDDSLKSSSHHHRHRKKTKQKHSPSSNGRARGGGCKPYLRCVYQTDMIICGVILYDPNVRDYICVHIERFRLERFRCRSASDEASSDDAIDRFVDGGTVSFGRRR